MQKVTMFSAAAVGSPTVEDGGHTTSRRGVSVVAEGSGFGKREAKGYEYDQCQGTSQELWEK